MNVRKFIAQTARDGLHKVKEVLGEDAIILSNRAIAGGVEIMAVASSDMELAMPPKSPTPSVTPSQSPSSPPLPQAVRPRKAADAPLIPPENPRLNEALMAHLAEREKNDALQKPSVALEKALHSENLSVSRNRLPEAPPLIGASPLLEKESVPPAQKTVETPAPTALPDSAPILEELRSLRKIVEQQLTVLAFHETARNEPIKTDVLRRMLDSGFSPRFSRDLLAQLPQDFDLAQAMNWVKRRTDRAFLTIDANSDIVDRGGIFALVGPTGVGKTTTAAKLAARCVLRHGADKVALITTDGYRIGAHEQLRIYGRILGIPVQLAKNEAELKQVLRDLSHKHMILVDSMGVGQRDRMVKEQLAMFDACLVKRLLVLSATSRGDTLDDVVEAYGGRALMGAILSKVDEAASLATSLDVILRYGFRLHYVSNGQRVPEDLHLPNRPYLMHRAFKGFTDNSPHQLAHEEAGLVMANAAESLLAQEPS